MVDVGDVNEHGQEVIENSGVASTMHYNQTIYVMRCLECLNIYGSNGCDVHIRKCPYCQGGAPGEPVPHKRSPPTPDENFSVGDYVYHENFGLGRVAGFSSEMVAVDFLDHDQKFIVPSYLSIEDADNYRTKILASVGYDRLEVDRALSEVVTLNKLIESHLESIDQLKIELGRCAKEREENLEIVKLLNTEKSRLEIELAPLRRALSRKGIKAWMVQKIFQSFS